MLITAAHPKNENVWRAAANCARWSGEGMDPAVVLVRVYTGQETETEDVEYGRYWHGYLIFLKPLLVVFNYAQIREILSLVQLVLFTAIVMLLVRKQKSVYVIPVLLWPLWLREPTL